ncbi:MAG: ABC transporter ATP-binding protein [Promethearchaeota archaeon]
MPEIVIEHLTKEYEGVPAVKDLSLNVHDGEYFTILGNTGGGKTTLLHAIGGLVKPTRGRILFDGRDITKTKPYERNLGLVFEQYALFPHFTVEENVSYSRRVKGLEPVETRRIARELLRMLHLSADRSPAYPHELSGGMQQRVALGRALMNMEEEGILLLDEPFKALDAGLRMNLRVEIRKLAKELKLTTIHITNDMTEAMMVSDRIALIRDGQVVQVGTPTEIYFNPNCLYAAYFMSDTVFFRGEVEATNGESFDIGLEDVAGSELRVSNPHQDAPGVRVGERVVVLVRNDHFKLYPSDRGKPPKENLWRGKIAAMKFMGAFTHFDIELEGGKLVEVELPTRFDTFDFFHEGDGVWMSVNPRKPFLFPDPGEEVLKDLYVEI